MYLEKKSAGKRGALYTDSGSRHYGPPKGMLREDHGDQNGRGHKLSTRYFTLGCLLESPNTMKNEERQSPSTNGSDQSQMHIILPRANW